MSRRDFLFGMAATLLPLSTRAASGDATSGSSLVIQAAGRPPGESLIALDTTGSADMSDMLQRAINAAGENSVLHFPAGSILLRKGVVNPFNRQRWIGAGRGATQLVFAPTEDASMLRFGKTDNITPQQSLRGMTLTTSDLAHSKTAVELVDISHFAMYDVEITGTKPVAGTLCWSGGPSGSIGVRTFGREAPRFGGDCYISADNPFRISKNLRRFSPQIDADFFSLRDVYMIAHGKPNILIDGDVELLNFLVDGCSMVRGTHAIKWIGAGATRATSVFSVRSCRWEQAEDQTAYAFDIQPDRNLYGLSFDGLSLPPGAHGFRLRNCIGPSFRQVTCNQGQGREVLNVDGSVTHMRHEDCYWGSNTSVSMMRQRAIWVSNPTDIREPLPRNGLYDSDSNNSFGLGFEGGLGGRVLKLQDRSTAVLGGLAARGWLFVVDDEGEGVQILLQGKTKGANVVAPAGMSSRYSTTAGTAGRTNVYWSAQASRYEIENLRGAQRTYRVVLIGTWSGE